MKERIQKILANAGIDSRRNIENMVRDGRVTVNGKVAVQLPVMVDPYEDEIAVDGERVRVPRPRDDKRAYILLYKPKGVYSTNVAQGEQVRAIDLLPPNLGSRLYSVGRLDAEAKGLLLLTNDGELTNKLTHPRYGVAKTYRVIVDGIITPEEVEMIQKGVWLSDPHKGEGFKSARSHVKIVKRLRLRSILEITMREGRNSEVRRTLARVGHKVRELTRVRMGPLTLDGLSPGQFRPLSPREIKALYKSAEPRPGTPEERAAKAEKPDKPKKPWE